MEMRKTLGVPIIERAVLHSHTAVIILDVYGDTTDDELAQLYQDNVGAVAVEDGASNSAVDIVGDVYVKPVWTRLVEGAEPPVELLLHDGVNPILTCPCSAMTRRGICCINKTSHGSGLCWRHRTGKCIIATMKAECSKEAI